jgi:2-polyprenyl-3-methyl-5-hydroxy-6-metoxy-1,4-benzoquinol methylase
MTLYDAQTIEIYESNAQAYAARTIAPNYLNSLKLFKSKLSNGGRVLDLGCGAGWAAESLYKGGCDVSALDAAPSLAAIASSKIRNPALVMRYDELNETAAYDGVFACNALHHVPKAGLPIILNKIGQSLRERGVFYACFASGSGEIRDAANRFYSLYQADELLAVFEQQPALQFASMRTESSIDELGTHQILLGILARRKPVSLN